MIAFVFLLNSLSLLKPALLAFAYPNTATEFYDYLDMLQYPQTTSKGTASWPTYRDYKQIVYGSPFGRYKTGSRCGNPDEYEYLGYSLKGMSVTNMCFPNDGNGTDHPRDWNYITVDNAVNSWNGIRPSVKNHIKDSNWTGNGATVNDPLRYSDIGSDSKAKVQVLPTWRGQGSVYTRHKTSTGKIWYATFIVPSIVADNKPLVDGTLTTDQDTYTIKADQDKVYGNLEVQAEAIISGYMRYEDISELKASYKGFSHKEIGQHYSTLPRNINFSRADYTVGTHTITLEGTVSIKSVFGDSEPKKVFKKVTLIVESPDKPTITANATTNPATKQFADGETLADVPVTVNAQGSLSGVNAANIDQYELSAKKDVDSVAQTYTFTGTSAQSLTQTKDFNFTVPQSLFASGTYTQNFIVTARATLKDGTVVSGNAYAATVISPPGSTPPPPPPPDPTPTPSNLPPEVTISGPNTVKAGDAACLNSTASDPDGTVVQQDWYTNGADGAISGSSGCIYYPSQGSYTVSTTVTDDQGATGSASHDIQVVPPYPTANFDTVGTLKENRRVDIKNSSSSPFYYPIDWTKSYWKITPLDSANSDAIKIKGNMSGDNTSQVLETLYKKPGQYKVDLYVQNTAGLSDSIEKTITIVPDELPKADFDVVTTTYRNANNNNQATLKLTDSSYSNDDTIGQRIWTYRFDSNNDGNFTDEQENVIDDTNLLAVDFPVTHVGKYLIELKSIEAFGQPTIDEFVTPDDRKRDDTSDKVMAEKVIEVKNLAPVVSFQVGKKKTVDLSVGVGESPYTPQTIESKLNAILKPALQAENIDLNLSVKPVGVNVNQPSDNGDFKVINSLAYGIKSSEEQFQFNTNEIISTVPSSLYPSLLITNLTTGSETWTKPQYTDPYNNYSLTAVQHIVLPDKTVLSTGGLIVSNIYSSYAISNIAAYDRNTDQWTDKQYLSSPRIEHTMTLMNNGKVFIGFGSDGTGNYFKAAQIYDPQTNNVTTTSNFKYGFQRPYSTTLKDGRVMIIGGHTLDSTNQYIDYKNYVIYNPADDTWQEKQLPSPYNTYYHIDYSNLHTLKDGRVSMTYGNQILLLDVDKNIISLGPTLPYKSFSMSLTDHNSLLITRARDMSNNYSNDLSEVIFPENPTYDFPIPKNDNKFNLLIENNVLSNGGITLINNRLKESKENFIGLGTSVNKTQIEDIIASNNKQGQYFDNTDIDSAIQQTADYILEKMTKQKVNLDFDIGNTAYKDQSLIQSKINEIIVPKLNNAGISLDNVHFLTPTDTTPKNFVAYNFPADWVSDLGGDTRGGLLRSSEKITLKGMGVEVGSNGSSQKIRFGIWDSNKNLIFQSPDIAATVGLNKFTFSTPVVIEANKDYFMGVYSNTSAMVRAAAASGNFTNTVDGVNFTYTTANQGSGFSAPQTNFGYAALMSFDFSKAGINKNGIVHESDSTSFYNVLDDQAIDADRENNILKNASMNNAFTVGLGNDTNKAQFEDIIIKNSGQGTFFDNSNLDSSLTNLADYIIEQVNKKLAANEVYLTLDEAATYFTYYNDAENDPKYTLNGNTGERWKYSHDPSAFENPMGVYEKNNQYQDSPVTQFTKTGMYQVTYAARDNPVTTEDAFDNYRLWSKEIDNYKIYVHRKPVPDFNFTINPSTGDYTLTNKAYDLDKLSIDIGNGGGIRALAYQWRVKGTDIWNDGLPPNPLERKVYEVKQEVYDFQGASAFAIKEMDATGVNKAPIADFDPIPPVIKENDTVKLQNKSVDPNGDTLTYQWYMRQDGSSTWQPFSTVENPSQQLNTVGDYWFKVKATDPYNATSESIEKKVTVISANTAPTPGFLFESPKHIGDTVHIDGTPASDPEGDTLTYEYVLTKKDATQRKLIFKSGDGSVDANGNVDIPFTQLADIGDWEIVQTVSDGQYTRSSDTISPPVLTILPLELGGTVTHTPEWTNIHNKLGHLPSEFYSGEKFVLQGTTTDYPIKQLTVTMQGEQKNNVVQVLNTVLTNKGPGIYDGSIADPAWLEPLTQLKQGSEVTFTFNVIYANDYSPAPVTVKVMIIGNAYKAFVMHRSY